MRGLISCCRFYAHRNNKGSASDPLPAVLWQLIRFRDPTTGPVIGFRSHYSRARLDRSRSGFAVAPNFGRPPAADLLCLGCRTPQPRFERPASKLHDMPSMRGQLSSYDQSSGVIAASRGAVGRNVPGLPERRYDLPVIGL
jgi:hypothetical protein